MLRHPIFDEFDASLAGVVPREPVQFTGGWQSAARRTYQAAGQLGTGRGPFADVLDFRWQGVLTCDVPIVSIAFLVTATECHWAKSAPPVARMDVEVSLHAYADYLQDRATFASSIGGAFLPGIPVAFNGDPVAVCNLRETPLTTARIEPIAHTDEAALVSLILPAPFIEVGRKRLWHVREGLASSVPPRVRDILTRRRSGSVPWE